MNDMKFWRVGVLMLIPTSVFSQQGWIIGWGGNSAGQSSGKAVTIPTASTVSVAGGTVTNAVAIAGGMAHGVALKADGTVVCWGWNQFDQADAPPGLGLVQAISASENYCLALQRDGTVVKWGATSQPGQSFPIANSTATNVALISAGGDGPLFLTSLGTLASGRPLPLGVSNIVAIAAGSGRRSSNLSLTSDGKVVEWDFNGKVQVQHPTLTNVVAIAMGDSQCLALRMDGCAVEWKCGSGEIVEVASNVVSIASYGNYSLVLRRDGTVQGWGHGRFYPRTVPEGLSNVVAIAVGGDFCLAITTNRAVAERFMPKGK